MHGTVIVTGATGGIGQATSLRLARHGLRVVAGTRDEAKADALRARAREHGVSLHTVHLDVTDETSCKQAVAEALDLGQGRLWAVVNNAGMAMGGAVEDISDEDAHDVIELNLIGPLRLARLALPHMRSAGRGRIVNVSSLAGQVAMPFMGWYCASKQGLEAATHALRMEAARDGVRVVTIRPGSYATHLWDGVFSRMDGEGPSAYADCYRRLCQAQPLVRRLPGPDPVAKAVVKAVTSTHPRARYTVGADARAGGFLDGVSPRPLADVTKRLLFGLAGTRRGDTGN
ncbi:SDR family oxidoreductase [Streptomyces sp. NPDC001393]